MAIGPGKYDELCTHVRETARANGAIIIVFGGDFGSGFSAQLTPEMTAKIPQLLRHIANDIESGNIKPGNVGITEIAAKA